MSTDGDLYYEAYGLNIDAALDLAVKLEVLSFYVIEETYTFTILDLTPYKQYLTWVRPEAILMGNKPGFDIQVKGEYDLHFLEVKAATNQDAKVFDKSFYDYFANLISGTFVWTDILPFMWADFSYAGQDTFDDPIVAWTPSALIDVSNTWYGTHTIWKAQLSNIIA